MWGLDAVWRHCRVPTRTPALPFFGPERLVEEAVLISAHSVRQEGLKTKQPKGVRHSMPSPRGDGQTPLWHFRFAWHPCFGQRNKSWRRAGVRREMPLPTHVWAGLCPPKDRLSPLSSTRLHPRLQPFRGSSTSIAALHGLACNFVGEKADFHSKAGLTTQWCFCLIGPDLAFGLRSVPCCVAAAPRARGSLPGAGTLPCAEGEVRCYSRGVSSGNTALKQVEGVIPPYKGKAKLKRDTRKAFFPS